MGILLIGAVACIAALLLSAWLMTFARWIPIEGIDGKFLVDYKTMIRAHVDFALMALFNLAFYGLGFDLPELACWVFGHRRLRESHGICDSSFRPGILEQNSLEGIYLDQFCNYDDWFWLVKLRRVTNGLLIDQFQV